MRSSKQLSLAVRARVGITMVSMRVFSLRELQRLLSRLRRKVVAPHLAGEGVLAVGPVLLHLFRVRRDMRRLMERERLMSIVAQTGGGL